MPGLCHYQPPRGLEFRFLLKELRHEKRWSQERLAEEAEMDHSLVSRLESGKRPPTRQAIRKLSQGLQLRPRDKDRLLMSAGYFPDHPESAVHHQPLVVQIYHLLEQRSTCPTRRQALEQGLAALIALASC